MTQTTKRSASRIGYKSPKSQDWAGEQQREVVVVQQVQQSLVVVSNKFASEEQGRLCSPRAGNMLNQSKGEAETKQTKVYTLYLKINTKQTKHRKADNHQVVPTCFCLRGTIKVHEAHLDSVEVAWALWKLCSCVWNWTNDERNMLELQQVSSMKKNKQKDSSAGLVIKFAHHSASQTPGQWLPHANHSLQALQRLSGIQKKLNDCWCCNLAQINAAKRKQLKLLKLKLKFKL